MLKGNVFGREFYANPSRFVVEWSLETPKYSSFGDNAVIFVHIIVDYWHGVNVLGFPLESESKRVLLREPNQHFLVVNLLFVVFGELF